MENRVIGLLDDESCMYALTIPLNKKKLIVIDTYPTQKMLEESYKEIIKNIRIDENKKMFLYPVEITENCKGRILTDMIAKYNTNVN
jgi:hypothetical protein